MAVTNKNKQYLQRINDSFERVQKGKHSSKYYNFAISDDSEGGLRSIHDRGVEAMLLSNFQKVYDSAECQNLITSPDYGPYVPEIWPVIAAWYPEFPLKELIAVEPMDKPLTYMFFSNLRAGTTKAPTQFGEMIETPLGMRYLHGSYPTGEVHGEELKEKDFQATTIDGKKAIVTTMAYYPLTVATGYADMYIVNVTAPAAVAGKYVSDYVKDGFIYLKKADGTNSGKVVMELNTAGLYIYDESLTTVPTDIDVKVNYVWDIENATMCNVPSVTEDILMLPMEARPRALGLKWTLFSEFVKKSQFGTDIRTDVTRRVLALLFQYQCRYILDTMYDYSTESAVTVEVPSANITVEAKIQQLLSTLNKIGQKIARNTGRMAGNRLVVGMDMKAWLESLPNTYWKSEDEGDKGYESPRKLGKIGNYEVYYDPQRADNAGFMTYRGSEWYDAAYYLGEFMPVVPTDAIVLGIEVREAFVSMEAHCYHKKNAVIPLEFVVE